MKRSITIKLKAAPLVIVSSISTIIGFACAMGGDMGFNYKHHHDDDEETPVPVNGKEHQHHHDESKYHHDSKQDSEKGGCCNDEVIKFQNLEKNLNQNNNRVIHPPPFATIVSNLWNINIFNCAKALSLHYKARVFHPPIHDILITIQRFQI
jgi:hypothetical protein